MGSETPRQRSEGFMGKTQNRTLDGKRGISQQSRSPNWESGLNVAEGEEGYCCCSRQLSTNITGGIIISARKKEWIYLLQNTEEGDYYV